MGGLLSYNNHLRYGQSPDEPSHSGFAPLTNCTALGSQGDSEG